MSRPSTARALIAEARRRFEAAGLAGAGTDARILVGHLAGLTTTQLITDADLPLATEAIDRIDAAVQRRLDREPVYRILGHRAFYGLDLTLSPETLEPRPDTEILVDVVLPHLRILEAKEDAVRIVDLGTGTGAIALALLQETQRTRAVGVDISADALNTALRNARANGLESRFEISLGSWYAALEDRFHVIVSNPPYIRSAIVETLEPEVLKHDPRRALDGGTDGLDAYRAIAQGAEAYLHSNGLIAVEIGYDQREDVAQIFEKEGFNLAEAHRDLAGRDRVLLFKNQSR